MAKKSLFLVVLALTLVALPALMVSRAAGTMLSASEVTDSKVKKIFSEEGWENSDAGENIKVETPEGRVFLIEWDRDKDLMAFVAYYNFEAGVTNKQKMELVNKINDEVVFCKAMVDKDGDLRFEYYLRYAAGITDRQILDAAKFFIMTTRFAVDNKDPNDLLK